MTASEEILDRLSKLECEVVSLRIKDELWQEKEKVWMEKERLWELERAELLETIDRLQKHAALNSGNSSKPPTSDDPFKKKPIKNRRVKTGKPVGGQKGREGKRLEPVAEPDHVVDHRLPFCKHCSAAMPELGGSYKSRQVFDVPPVKVEVTEHRAHTDVCPNCGLTNIADFPEEVTQPTQYGFGIAAMLMYWRIFQLLPVGRIAKMAFVTWKQSISTGTIINMSERLFGKLRSYEASVKELIKAAKLFHSDETGARTEGELYWMHVYSTLLVTLYFIHPNRGLLAMGDIGILAQYSGTVVHDRFKSYFTFFCRHAICNAHILRDLIYLKEEEHCAWAQSMIDLLLEALRRKHDDKLTEEYVVQAKEGYLAIVSAALAALPPPKAVENPGKKGPPKRTKEHNLLLDLEKLADSILLFMTDPDVPFDNNLAERDLRMVKLLIKVSGCFRTYEAAMVFARNRGYISTLQKNEQDVLKGIELAFKGQPFMPKAA